MNITTTEREILDKLDREQVDHHQFSKRLKSLGRRAAEEMRETGLSELSFGSANSIGLYAISVLRLYSDETIKFPYRPKLPKARVS